MNGPKFNTGDMVRKTGTWDLKEYEVEVVSPNGDVKLKGSEDWVWGGHLELVVKITAPAYRPWQCECGAEHVGSKRHSTWCIKYNKWA